MRLALLFSRKKEKLTPEQINLIALREKYQLAIDDYRAAIDTYNFAVCENSENENVLYQAMILARDKVDNMKNLIEINT